MTLNEGLIWVMVAARGQPGWGVNHDHFRLARSTDIG